MVWWRIGEASASPFASASRRSLPAWVILSSPVCVPVGWKRRRRLPRWWAETEWEVGPSYPEVFRRADRLGGGCNLSLLGLGFRGVMLISSVGLLLRWMDNAL